jgi:hypothetical protein
VQTDAQLTDEDDQHSQSLADKLVAVLLRLPRADAFGDVLKALPGVPGAEPSRQSYVAVPGIANLDHVKPHSFVFELLA